VRLEGGLDRVSAEGDVRLGPYRGPLRFSAQFPRGGAGAERADFNGVLDASTLGLSGPSGSTVGFVARFDGRGGEGQATIRSKAFDGLMSWRSGADGKFAARGLVDAAALRAVGAPISKSMPARVPARIGLDRHGRVWSGRIDADAYSGALELTEGAMRRLRYTTLLSPAAAQRVGMAADPAGKPTPVAVDVAMTGNAGAASYSAGSWLGQVNWSQLQGGRTQYRWRATLSPADLHALGLPASIRPRRPLSIDATLTSAAGALSGSAQAAGGVFRFTASPPEGGLRKLSVTGQVDGAALAELGLAPPGVISGPTSLTANLDAGPEGVRGGRLEADLTRAAVNAPFATWKKPAGRNMRLSAEFARRSDGAFEAREVKGQGPGFALDASGLWRPNAEGVLHVARARLDGAFEGALDLETSSAGRSLSVRARYFDARRLLQEAGKAAAPARGGGAGEPGANQVFHLDADLAQVRVGDRSLVRNVRLDGEWGAANQRKLDVRVVKDDGGRLVELHLVPDAGGMSVRGEVTDVGETAWQVFGRRSFKGGQASVTGRMAPGGADLDIEMTKVRLVQAPALARILTVGSLHAMGDMLNGSGIEFTKVVAPVSIRGARMTIGRARATGPAMGVTTQGVIDLDARTVDLSGGIAPSYVLNSAMGAVPFVGDVLISHKGEGMFGLTYSAKGAFLQPKISVNPFSLATPGILRRIFESRSAAVRPIDATPEQGG
jgi:hypothetical protein